MIQKDDGTYDQFHHSLAFYRCQLDLDQQSSPLKQNYSLGKIFTGCGLGSVLEIVHTIKVANQHKGKSRI